MGNRKEHKIENEVEIKHCPTCDSWKDLSEYNKQSSSWDKLARMCRKCYCEYKTDKRKNDEKYKQSDILYNENINGSNLDYAHRRYTHLENLLKQIVGITIKIEYTRNIQSNILRKPFRRGENNGLYN